MIIVTGTKRSGTSMWMQVLAAAGFPVIGERFPAGWEELLGAANPDGFYESELVEGVYYRTNPHPRSGRFLFPEQTRDHAVKVFVPGLVRTDLAFIDRVIATVRHPCEYVASMARLRGIVDRESDEDVAGLRLPPTLEWWSDNFALVRDLATRRYAVHVLSYDRLLDDPVRTIGDVLDWLGGGDSARATAAVRPGNRTQDESARDPAALGVAPAQAETFVGLWQYVHDGRALSKTFIDELNATERALQPLFLELEARRKLAAIERLTVPAGDGG